MADDPKPDSATPDDDNKPKLPPRTGDWHSGLKRDDPEAYKAKANPTGEGLRDARSIMDSGAPLNDDGEAIDPTQLTYDTRRSRVADYLIALILGLLTFASVATTYKGFGHSWDEALYLKPAESAAAWMLGFFNSGDTDLLSKQAIDSHWGQSLDGHDPLHPEVAPVPKLLIGAGLTYLSAFTPDPMEAMRLPNAILFALTIALLYLLGSREYGRIGGFGAALMYVLMPRVFGHAHIAASETPLAFFTLLTVWCFLIGNRVWAFALFTGIAFGLAVSTKVSAFMLPVPLMIWGQIYRRRDYASNVFAMIFVAPVIMLAVWPWLWYDTFHRFFSYLMFYLEHQVTAVFYLGRVWGYTRGPAAPIYYPLHIAAVAIPVWILVFLALGVLRSLLSTVRRPVTVLFSLMAISWFALSMLPNAPRYDGERLFFPAFAFLALLAGGGVGLIFDWVYKWRVRRGSYTARRETGFIATITLLLLAAYGTAEVYFSHPNQLNFFNWIVGKSQGAYDKEFETSYWGEAVNEDVVDYLNEILEPGDRVKTLALNSLAFENLREWDKLPPNVDFSPASPPYDYHIMQIRQGFMGRAEWSVFYKAKPLRTFEAQGVPRIVIYRSEDVDAVLGVPVEPIPVADAPTTASESLTTTTVPVLSPDDAATTDTPEATTTPDDETPLPGTTVTVTAIDWISTPTTLEAPVARTTNAVSVLDLPNSNTVTYQDELPTTEPLTAPTDDE